MPPSRTKTVKNKHSGSKSGVSGSKASKSSGPPDGVVRKRSTSGGAKTPTTTAKQVRGRSAASMLNKKKKKVYTEKELGLPQLNMITPIGVTKPKGKKKGKVFVDDRESMSTILALVQADKDGQIESKMIKARQMEDIREARRVEAEKKDAERKGKLDETKESLRRKRKRPSAGSDAADEFAVKDVASSGSRASKTKKKKVAFA